MIRHIIFIITLLMMPHAIADAIDDAITPLITPLIPPPLPLMLLI